MRLVDTFLFSEPHEADVLWVKLNVEDALIQEWVVVENSYTHQGEHKGHHLNELLRSDQRFAQFLPKLHVIECAIRLGERTSDGRVFDGVAQDVERAQREAATSYLIDKYDDLDYVLISDVDECLDAEPSRRRRLLRRKISNGGDLILVPRIRYWFDYDNRGLGRRCVPLVSIAQIRRDGRLNHYRESWIGTPVVWRHDMIFEYSYCYSREKIQRKFDTFIHTGFESSEIDAALRYNHRPTSQHRSRQLAWTNEDWFVRRRLRSRNSPAFVRTHLSQLKTSVVDPAFSENRMADFPEFFPRNRSMRVMRWTSLYARMYLTLLNANTREYTTPLRQLKALVAARIKRGPS